MSAWYEVYSVVEGAFDSELSPLNESEADDAAQRLADELASEAVSVDGSPLSWQVFVLPHYCDRASGSECECVQYLTDHHPVFSSVAS